MKIEQLDEMPREERVRTMAIIMRVVLAARAYDQTSSTPQRTNDALVAARSELHEAVQALESIAS